MTLQRWQIRAKLSKEGAMSLAVLDDLGRESPTPLQAAGPVELLVAAVAGCFAKSCHMVLSARSEAAVAVEADVLGEKSGDKPARVARVEIRYRMPDLTADHAAKIAKDAKRICTVTNSMSCDFKVVD